MDEDDGCSEGQDLSEEEQNAVLEQVLDELMPDRERKPFVKLQKEEPKEIVKKPVR